jgi:hypothetical protein
MPRPPLIHHCTSQPRHFFGREAELALLDKAVRGGEPSVAALVGPGGQGKTAIVQHWLERCLGRVRPLDGLFLWSFYRNKDSDSSLRELYAYAAGIADVPDSRRPAGKPDLRVSASYCVDYLLDVLRREQWAVVFDGTEVVQHDTGAWFGRFIHPELGRLVDEIASGPAPGVMVLTTRFPLPTLATRSHARIISLSALDPDSARGLLASFGVQGGVRELDEAAASCGGHAKAVELLGTLLVRFHSGKGEAHRLLPELAPLAGASAEEIHVARVLAGYYQSLSPEAQDIVALATSFRHPPAEGRLLEYLASAPLQHVLRVTWGRRYMPFAERPAGWLARQLNELVELRLLERVGVRPGSAAAADQVIDAHPLVRRGFEHVLGSQGQEHSARTRAGFLRGRPDRRPPASLEQAREEVELFHAYCDAGLWNEADGVYVALENPKHRFLAPAFEGDLLVRFFPEQDWRQPPLWAGFGRYRSLAICFELLGQFEDALEAYRESDTPLRGDALIALGRLQPLLDQAHVRGAWQSLWHAYRAHALCLAGQVPTAVATAAALVPVDVYEWVHVFECLLRAGRLDALDLGSLLYRPPLADEHLWTSLARRRMRADYVRLVRPAETIDLKEEYQELLEAYDRSGLPYERALTRLGYARFLLDRQDVSAAEAINQVTLELAQRHHMQVVAADGWELAAEVARRRVSADDECRATANVRRLRDDTGYHGPSRI